MEWRVREGAMSTRVVAYLVVEEETPFLSSSGSQDFFSLDRVWLHQVQILDDETTQTHDTMTPFPRLHRYPA